MTNEQKPSFNDLLRRGARRRRGGSFEGEVGGVPATPDDRVNALGSDWIRRAGRRNTFTVLEREGTPAEQAQADWMNDAIRGTLPPAAEVREPVATTGGDFGGGARGESGGRDRQAELNAAMNEVFRGAISDKKAGRNQRSQPHPRPAKQTGSEE